jgi:ribosomal protein S18 acetylase RimI-like enzyme
VRRRGELTAVARRRAEEADRALLEDAHLAALGPVALIGYGWTKERLRTQFHAEVVLAQCQVISAGLLREMTNGGDMEDTSGSRAGHVDWRDVGYISIEDRVTSWYIDAFAILPRYQRLGIGAATMRSVLGAADGRTVRLSVLRTNPARSLYLRLGFVTIAGDRLREQMEWRW